MLSTTPADPFAPSGDPAHPSLGDRLAAFMGAHASYLVDGGETGEGDADEPALRAALALLADLRCAQGATPDEVQQEAAALTDFDLCDDL